MPLPTDNDLLTLCFSYLTKKELAILCVVSKIFKVAASDNMLWHPHAKVYFANQKISITDETILKLKDIKSLLKNSIFAQTKIRESFQYLKTIERNQKKELAHQPKPFRYTSIEPASAAFGGQLFPLVSFRSQYISLHEKRI